MYHEESLRRCNHGKEICAFYTGKCHQNEAKDNEGGIDDEFDDDHDNDDNDADDDKDDGKNNNGADLEMAELHHFIIHVEKGKSFLDGTKHL